MEEGRGAERADLVSALRSGECMFGAWRWSDPEDLLHNSSLRDMTLICETSVLTFRSRPM